MSNTKNELDKLLETYSPDVRDTVLAAREMIRATIPDLKEMVDRSARVVAYGFGPGYRDMICTIIRSKGA